MFRRLNIYVQFAGTARALGAGGVRARRRASLSIEVSDESELLCRITADPKIFGGKPIVRGRRLAVEHVLGMLAAGDSIETIVEGYPWLERDDVRACLAYARRANGNDTSP